MRQFRKMVGGLAVLGALTLAVGCGQPTTAPKGGTKADKGGKADDHAHGAGPHGGAIGDWGGGKMHIEFTVNHDTQEAIVYILGSDMKKPVPIKAKDGQITGAITGVKDKGAFEVVLKAVPEAGDPAGTSSKFVGKHEKIGVVQEFEGTITGENDGTPYTGKFKEEPAK